ncbi:MAG: hypothetical protein A2846_01915 [Candidatus Doudnabacteria bacterium RIFCSPHIGHO2_01_FULL_49_9]|uniref:Uncharacterized protein n=1 Tax=Candidatus Doudnabacteria bacterium RIFCSPHIGHO2_01_FULL_49_9 TaxID=1817827 RepID=A0A1F5P3D8_9BACT|nr:MAG: hypothetical protein A2846_01915 [Candidatus Doudnabacteria bacterium RIFCSPHIGHO2_01_FULL_49_9]
MVLQKIAEIIFYGLAAVLGLYSMVMVYILLRFGLSKMLGLVLSSLYVLVIVTLYAAAVGNFLQLNFPEFAL